MKVRTLTKVPKQSLLIIQFFVLMNILFYTPRAFAISETFIYNLIDVKDIKYNLFIAYNTKENTQLYPLDNITSIKIPSFPKKPVDRVLSKIIRLSNKQYSNLPLFSRKKLIKFIKTHNIDTIYCQYGISAISVFEICKNLKLNLVIHFHGYDASSLLNNPIYKKSLKTIFLSNINFHIIVVADYMIKNLTELEVNKTRITKIPYGIPLNPFSVEKTNNSNKLKILHAGRLTPKKGVPDFLRCISHIKDQVNKKIEVIVIGDGEDYNECQTIITEENLESIVRMTGAQPHHFVIQAMLEADIFVLNSRITKDGDKEGFPNTIMEAMAAKCAIISTKHAGIPDAIDNRINGILVDEYDNDAMEDQLMLLIKDDNYRLDIAQSAKQKAFNEFSKELMITKVRQVLDKI